MKRREARIKARAAGITSPVSDGGAQMEDAEVEKMPTLTIPKRKLKGVNSLPTSPSTEMSEPVFPARGRPRDDSTIVNDGSAESIRQRERAQASMRVCARKHRIIPLKHQLQKASRLNLGLENCPENLLSPEEERFITNKELADYQEKFREWKKHEDRSKMTRRVARGTGNMRRVRWAEQRVSSISTPETELLSSTCSSIDGGYVFITRGWDVEDHSSDEERGVESGSHRTDSSEGKLRRQRKIDISSPTEEREFVGLRPRTNAISEVVNTSPTHKAKQTALKRKQPSIEKTLAERGSSCHLTSRSPRLANTYQKSCSDPELRDLETAGSHEYLTILPPDSPKKKRPKKPIPTPRTQKPEKLIPESLPLYVNTLHTTPPTPPPNGSVSYGNMGLDRLLSSQRSLSESNLFKGGSDETEDNEYVDMTQFQGRHLLHPHYINYSDLNEGNVAPPLCDPSVTLRGKLRPQKSGSVGDKPLNLSSQRAPLYVNSRGCVPCFFETEDIYENGQHCMEFYLYGNTGGDYSFGDSGLGSTPSCSPLLCQRSFSLNDVRQAGSLDTQYWEEEVKRMDQEAQRAAAAVGPPCKWLTPRCGRGREHPYENLPPIATS